ncbi:asparaginase [Phytomonospora sp. NPDC050363]|uniref:asparaginase n=1 Tax=Phytomonospora sp. NPDC050363 TaxID=3155642 RepID=UPI0033EEDF2B
MSELGDTGRAVRLAEVVRGGFVESVHLGHTVVVDVRGEVVYAAGDPEVTMLPRSSAKPLQAVASQASGAGLSGELLAVACGSHTGEEFHVEAVDAILDRAGLPRAALRNVADYPEDLPARYRLVRAGGEPAPVYMNCSGKHAAMLAACVVNGWDLDGYLDPAHPMQRIVVETVERLAGETVPLTVTDGCGAPCPAVSLAGLARTFGRLAAAPGGTLDGAVAGAMRAHPEYVGGTGHVNTRFARLAPGAIVKGGAEGVLVAAMPDGTSVAVKCLDGNPRATTAAGIAALRLAGVALPDLGELTDLTVSGGGRPAGHIAVTVKGRA